MRMIPLPARCDRAAAEALLPELRTAAAQGAAQGTGPVQIDASGAEQIGQAVLQLLVSARRTGAGAQIQPSPALMEAARLTGLESVLFDGVVS